MTSANYGEMTPGERAAHITWRMARGEQLTARQIADEYRVCRKAAYDVLRRTSRVVPLVSDAGVWCIMEPTCPDE